MEFDPAVWHPNVSSRTGSPPDLCLEILKKEWSPALTIRTTLITVQALLAEHQLAESLHFAKVALLEAKCLAVVMVSHARLGKHSSPWAKKAIDHEILRMVCEDHVLVFDRRKDPPVGGFLSDWDMQEKT
jgi:hypothetical protein